MEPSDDLMIHRTMNGCSTTELHLVPFLQNKAIILSHYPKHSFNFYLQAVVAMIILAEKGHLMSEVLVERGCHEILFEVLENYNDNQGKVVTDVFILQSPFVLAESHDKLQQSRILLVATYTLKGKFRLTE